MSDPRTRVGDDERERVVADLREHAAAGRLEVEELEERVSAAYAARTHGDFAPLLRDLPSLGDTRRRAARAGRERAEAFEHARVWTSVSLLLVAIWALSGFGYFWPAWAICCWGIFVVMHVLSVTRPRRRPAGRALRA